MRTVGWVLLGLAGAGLGAGLLGILGLAVGASTTSVAASVAGRTVLTLAALALVALLVSRRGPWWWWAPPVAVLTAAIALDPLTWTASARAGGPLFGVWATGSAPAGLALDLLVWLLVALGAVCLGLRTRED